MHNEEVIDSILARWSDCFDNAKVTERELLKAFLDAVTRSSGARQAILTAERRIVDPSTQQFSHSLYVAGAYPDSEMQSHQYRDIEAFHIPPRGHSEDSLLSAIRFGPFNVGSIQVGDNEVQCTFYIQREGALPRVTLSIFGRKDIANPVFRSTLDRLIRVYLTEFENHLIQLELTESYPKRLGFHNKLLAVSNMPFDAGLSAIASAWQTATGADWVWIWMYNVQSKQWEFLSCDPHSKYTHLPPHVRHDATTGILAYAWRKRYPITNANPLNWTETIDNVTYQIVCRNDLIEKRCADLDCVPCILDENHNASDLQIGVCLHYRSETKRTPHPQHSLQLMGRHTNGVIVSLFNNEKRKILEELNKITANVLASGEYRPLTALQEYSASIIRLITQRLRVKFVSIFYRRWNVNTVCCVGSTGLFDSEGHKIPEQFLMEQTYTKGEGVTGGVYFTGIPYVHQIGNAQRHKAKYSETPVSAADNSYALAIYPIEFHSQKSARRICGVVRCADASPVLSTLAESSKNFDSFQLEMLKFISAHVAVAFEILLAFREREKNISTAKHDLIAPLQGIRDIIERVSISSPTPEGSVPRITEAAHRVIQNLSSVAHEINSTDANQPMRSGTAEARQILDRFKTRLLDMSPQINRECRLLIQYIETLRSAVDDSLFPPKIKRGYRKQLADAESAIRTMIQEFVGSTFSYKQPLCVIPSNDAENLRTNSERARAMVNNLELHLADPKEFRPTPTHIAGDILARLCNSLARWARETHAVRIQFDLASFKSTIPSLLLDRDEIERTVANLLVNAIKYSFRNTTVRVEPRRTLDSYFVDFINEGIGILSNEVEALFVEGYRSPRAIAYASGDGFGLKIAKSIMKKHGGDVVVMSPGTPTVVSLKFPRSLESQPPIN